MPRKKAVPDAEILDLNGEESAKIKRQKEREKRVKAEVERLSKQFEDIEESKKQIVKSTIEDAAFLTVMMRELQQSIMRDGTMIHYQNGANQWGEKQSPDSQLYIQMSQKLNAANKLLLELKPKADTKASAQSDDGFDEFVYGREE